MGIRHEHRRHRAGLTKRLTNSTTGDDDVDPAYLPAGAGFVFASNRQRATVDLPSGTDTYAAP